VSIDNRVRELFRCPQCRGGCLIAHMTENELVCAQCRQVFPVSNERPVLLRNDNLLFRVDDYIAEHTPSRVSTLHKVAERFVPGLSVNLSRERILGVMRDQLIKSNKPIVLVVGSAGQRKWLNERLQYGESVIVYSDIDIDADIDLFCDAHDLPFHDGCFDAVVTTAVLEHVMYPERAASEIARVLKVGGLLYSELPFIQQVHEGAYDFTRYTLGGHRRLFNRFDELDAGMVAGPGTSLAWSIENFVLAFFIGKKVRLLMKIFVRLGFSWFRYFDYLLKKRPQAMDGASCTYLYGRKMEGRVADSDIVGRYTGAKHLKHTGT
jgi:SAM-dependent methyltransferase